MGGATASGDREPRFGDDTRHPLVSQRFDRLAVGPAPCRPQFRCANSSAAGSVSRSYIDCGQAVRRRKRTLISVDDIMAVTDSADGLKGARPRRAVAAEPDCRYPWGVEPPRCPRGTCALTT